MVSLRYAVLSLAGVAVLAACGCKTDPLFESRQRVDAPTTSWNRAAEDAVPDVVVVDADEVDLVEAVLNHRGGYHQALTALRDFYQKHGHHRKWQWAEYELADVERIKPFKYILDAEVPLASLRPTDSIAEADSLYDKAEELMMQGGHKVPALYREDLMLGALRTLTELISRYPSSDKIDDAAFLCGEIHKEYFKNQEEIALKWYERAWTWDANTPHPARFQAAVVTDFRLHDRARALELYHQVLEHETDNRSNTAFAVRRIGVLSDDVKGRPHRPVSDEAVASPVGAPHGDRATSLAD
ncbi:MAG: hypothetical protein GY842_24810 [bacterium]|nr:hypothetical protein [bacterium]